MNKILSLILFLLVVSTAIGQVIGLVDKKTKEFSSGHIKYRQTKFAKSFGQS
ncbi:MAG TPA: hypothetical protein VGN00_07685 [Puia sp.]|jgi:hypothetical protein